MSKAVCQRCKRTIDVQRLDDGTTARLDNEILLAVATPGGGKKIEVRQLHENVCSRYVTEVERAKAEILRRREIKADVGGQPGDALGAAASRSRRKR